MASVVPRVQMISSALRALMNLAARSRAASNALVIIHERRHDRAGFL
jgi:hypothetical protein